MTETSLIVLPEQPPEIKPPTYREIKVNDFIALKKGGVDNAPDAPHPFWILAKDGLFLHRRNILGRGIVKQDYLPKHLPKLGEPNGFFEWEIEPVPSAICSKIVSFFKEVFERHKSEAEVILLMNYDTYEWDILVPLQKVTYASVESVLNPADVPDNYQIVGTAHSHCDFGAFHSGTDMADAEDMDGVHFTLGKLTSDEIEIAAMVMINGVPFTYKTVTDIAEFDTVEPVEIPEEWFSKIKTITADITDEEKELFTKFGKKRVFTVPTPQQKTPTTYHKPYTYKPYADNYAWYGDQFDYESDWVNYRDTDVLVNKNSPRFEPNKPKESTRWDNNTAYWEDYLDDKLIDTILDADIFTDTDLDRVVQNPHLAQSIDWWRSMFLVKLAEAANVLDKLGMVVEYSAKIKEKPVENQKSTLAERLAEEGFDILEVKEDGTVVIDVAKV